MKPVNYNRVQSSFPSMGSFFDDFFTKNISDFIGSDMRINSVPAVNIRETEDSYEIEVAAPGMNKEEFGLRVEKDHLIISGESRQSQETEEENFRRREFAYNQFQRRFYLPDSIQKDKIQAEYTDGILRIALPKTEEEKSITRSIEIK